MGLPTGADAEITLPRAEWRPPDFSAVQEFLVLLAKAVHQFRTYPATSPLCTQAVAAAGEALEALQGRNSLLLRVAATQLFLEEAVPLGGPAIENELVRRLRRAQVASVEFGRSASTRELAHFCSLLVEVGPTPRAVGSFGDLLVERGVASIVVRNARRPVVVEAGVPSDTARKLVEHQRHQRSVEPGSVGPMRHLYPPDKGWVLVDPAVGYDSLSLLDVAVLVEEPLDIAIAIKELVDDDPSGAGDPDDALTEKFSDLATLFRAAEPQLSQVLMSRLARAVLSLDVERRTALLRSTVLPGLLDADLDVSVLTSFPDLELADSLCLLLDLETTVPEVLNTALNRLDLSTERRQALAPVLAERMRQRQPKDEVTGPSATDRAIERYAKRLIEFAPADSRSFSEFASFDLSVTDETRAALEHVTQVIAGTDAVRTRLETAYRLTRLEPNPALVTEYLGYTMPLLASLAEQDQWALVGEWGGLFRDLADAGRTSRPEAAEAVLAELRAFCSPRRLAALADRLPEASTAHADASAFLDGFGEVAASAIISSLDDPDESAAVQRLLPLLGEQAAAWAPLLTTHLPTATGASRLAIIYVLGEAGPSYGLKLTALLRLNDEPTTREVLRALVRIGTTAAASAVAGQLTSGARGLRTAALEALLNFTVPSAAVEIRKLLENRQFVRQQPETACRLLDHLGRDRIDSLRPLLASFGSYRFHFWNPGLRRLALKSRRLLLGMSTAA